MSGQAALLEPGSNALQRSNEDTEHDSLPAHRHQDRVRDCEGLMGMSILGLGKIAFDFQHSGFCWKK